MSNSFGNLFAITTFGESHGKSVGVIVEGCPPGLNIDTEAIQSQLSRRRPGQSSVSTARDEKDIVQVLSGIEDGVALGSPIEMQVENTNIRPGDYKSLENIPRPSHADYTYRAKYGEASRSGGGRSSARETIGRVAAGSIAEILLAKNHGIEIVAWVSSVGGIDAPDITEKGVNREEVDINSVRCPDPATAEKMIQAINDAKSRSDSLGGVVTCVCRNVPAGLGEPVFDKAEALLAHAMLSIPAAKGFESGSGFAGASMRGSEHNDLFIKKGEGIGTATNRSGGIQGGITNGEDVVFRVAFKPPSSIAREQETVDYDGNPVTLVIKGRHDPCVVPRAVPVVESMAALVLADLSLIPV